MSEIDSLRVRISLDKVRLLSDELLNNILPVDVFVSGARVGEIEERPDKIKREPTHKVEENGKTTTYYLRKVWNKYHIHEKCLIILVNSKLLESRYFEGITSSNLPLIYKALQSQKVAEFTYEDFLSAQCTDTDFKQDAVIKDFSPVLAQIVAVAKTKSSSKLGEGYESSNTASNKMIQFAGRGKGSLANPFLKFYHKGIELKANSDDFANSYLQGQQYSNMVRAEFTIKDKKHFAKYGIEDTTLGNIASLPSEKKQEMFSSVLGYHLGERKKIVRVSSEEKDIPIDDIITVRTLRMILGAGISFQAYTSSVLEGIHKSSKSRKLKKYTELYSKYIKGSNDDKITKSVDDFFDQIGWH